MKERQGERGGGVKLGGGGGGGGGGADKPPPPPHPRKNYPQINSYWNNEILQFSQTSLAFGEIT